MAFDIDTTGNLYETSSIEEDADLQSLLSLAAKVANGTFVPEIVR
jgi:hypothetical protein